MVIRVVVTVLLAAALVGAVLPAVDTARDDHAAALARDELVDFRASSAEFIAENDPPPPGVAGPSLLVTVRVPDGVTLRVGVGPRGESLGHVVGHAVAGRVSVFELSAACWTVVSTAVGRVRTGDGFVRVFESRNAGEVSIGHQPSDGYEGRPARRRSSRR